MAEKKRGRHERHGGHGPTRPRHSRPRAQNARRDDEQDLVGEGELDLVREVRRARHDEHPIALLALASGLLAVLDPRDVDPYDPEPTDVPDRDELIASFVASGPDMASLALAVVVLDDDDLRRARVRRALADHLDDLPPWLVELRGAEVPRVVEMRHVLGDGENLLLDVRLPEGHGMTVVAYVDHNVGTIVKDAYVIDKPIKDAIRFISSIVDNPDTTVEDVDRADTRVELEGAIAKAALTYPPYETDSWPACRAILEWAVRGLPPGGRRAPVRRWSEDELRELADRFFASDLGSAVDTERHRDLLDEILWFGSSSGPGDPMRWSPVVVEILLVDWIPRYLIIDADHLQHVPEVLRLFIRFCHRERRIPAHLTAETVAAVDRWKPELFATRRALGALGEYELSQLRDAVGGDEALRTLTFDPLPDEPFDWSGLDPSMHAHVDEVLRGVDAWCDEQNDIEARTVGRRVLAMLARRAPERLARSRSADQDAAAVCWIVGRANAIFSPHPGGARVKDLAARFGTTSSRVSARAQRLLATAGLGSNDGSVALGSPDFLTSRARLEIDRQRRYWTTP